MDVHENEDRGGGGMTAGVAVSDYQKWKRKKFLFCHFEKIYKATPPRKRRRA